MEIVNPQDAGLADGFSAFMQARQDPRWQREMAEYLAVDLDNQPSADHALLQRMKHIQALYEIEHEYAEKR